MTTIAPGETLALPAVLARHRVAVAIAERVGRLPVASGVVHVDEAHYR